MPITPVRQHEPRKKDQATRVRKKKAQTMEIALRGPTGPRTRRGKQRSRYNAVKHGIFSEVVLKERESTAQYQSLLNSLVEDFQPEGALEALLVEKLAMALWRHRRLVQAECAEIAKVTEFVEEDEKHHGQSVAGSAEHLAEFGGGMVGRDNNPHFLDRALDLLAGLRDGIEARGFDIEADGKKLCTLYGYPRSGELPKGLCRDYALLAHRAGAGPGGGEGKPRFHPEDMMRRALARIDEEMERVVDLKKRGEKIEARRMGYTRKTSLVPSAEVLDRLLRYEASLDRAFDRTLSQLERLQRMRLGHAVPPPVKVELSR
jgi:hypothetical protein